MTSAFETPAWTALFASLRCPACAATGVQLAQDPTAAVCTACGLTHAIREGILHIDAGDIHPEVAQERASVPATEQVPELGGWKDERYAPGTDPASPLGSAYLSLPYDNGSRYFQEPGYFQNVARFAPEFDLLTRHLPSSGLLLDVGADGTWSTARFARRGLTCIALDITDHLALAHLFHSAGPDYALVNVDMHEPVFADATFDAITAINAMHHSKRLTTLAANLGRVLRPDGLLAFIEPYVQNEAQETSFGAAQTASGINENVHTIGRWHQAFSSAGLDLDAYALTDAFNAVYRKRRSPSPAPLDDTWDILHDYYAVELSVTPDVADVRRGSTFEFEVTIENLGRAAWSGRGPQPVALCYHRLRVTPDGRVMAAFDNERTPLASFITRDQPQTQRVAVTLHEPGTFDLEFDLVHEGRSWFRDRGGRSATARVTVR